MKKHFLKATLLLMGLMGTLTIGIVNAQEACGSGYVENAAGTGCELIQVTFDANGGNFSGGKSTKNVDTRLVEVYQRIYKYSHTENVNDSGVKLSNYGNNWNNSNIRGTDRTSAVNEAHVVTITGANSLRVDLYYNGDNRYSYNDYVSVWKGSHPLYTAKDDRKSGGAVTTVDGGNSINIYGGTQGGTFVVNGNTLTNMGHNRLTIPGDTVTFGFTSDGGSYGKGYGYYAVISSETDIVEDYGCVYDISNPEREGYIFGGWYTDENFTHRFDTSACSSENTTVYAKWNEINTKNIIIEATATEANQTLKINKYFSNNYVVDWGDGTVGNLSSDTTHTYSGEGIYNIVLSLTGGANRWTFINQTYPYKSFVPQAGTTMSGVKIIYMPSLAEGFGESASNPGDYFFARFNNQGAITSLPEGSFDTSSVTIAGDYFFDTFNSEGGLITSLPEGSFDTSNITSVGNRFFSYFSDGSEIRQGSVTDYVWTLESLPERSFDISNITTVGDSFFEGFNEAGGLTSLPEGSFKLSTGLTTVGNDFFYVFNEQGALESLPEESFDISNITSVGHSFFSYFNWDGQLTSLPVGSFRLSTGLTTAGDSFFYVFNAYGALESLPEDSFDTSNITAVGGWFFSYFNEGGQLTSLPEGSFDTNNITTVGDGFFYGFNEEGQLTSLPEGSFRLSTGLTTVGTYFFAGFNGEGQLKSLPEGSFKTENITTVGNSFFSSFNRDGALTSLPEGSFDTSNITSVGNGFFSYFNYSGAITNLPNSFKLNPLGASSDTGYYASYKNAFNSPNYTLNKKVSDLVSGMTVPLDDRDTFSDNQPGRCGVHENWLVNPVGICDLTVTFNANGGTEIDPESASSGDKIILPETTKTGYILDGWYDELSGGNKVGDAGDTFIVGGNQILYASRKPNQYTITLDIDGTLTTITGDYGSPVNKPSNPSKNGYTFKGWEPEIPDTMPAENMTVKAKWERNGSSGGGGGGGGGGGSSSSSSTGSNTTPGSDTSNNTGNQQTGSGANSSTGTQNEQPTSGTKINEPEGTGKDIKDTQDSSADKSASEGQEILSPSDSSFTKEQKDAYEFAKGHGITTMPTIQKADMDGKLTRIAMAKMLSQYAINVLGKTPDTTQNNKFNDVTDKQNSDYDNGVTLAYQLGIMGQNMPGNNFRPDDEVTRAEFATALSRMIYGTSDGVYKSTDKYYTNHMEKLVEEGIITKDDPKMKELRGYVMIMLMRSAK